MSRTATYVKVFAWLLLCLAGVQDACGQDVSRLRLLVTSGADGNPVAGANVILRPVEEQAADDRRYAGATDASGYLQFGRVEPGRYRLRVSFIGHETHVGQLALEPGQRRVERISLSVKTQQLGEVVVRQERQVTVGEAGVRQIGDADLERIPTPAPGGDLASSLQTLPGVVSVGDRGGNFFVRGGTPTQNQTLVDNLPIVKPFHISNLFSAFPAEMVQKADLYAGGAGAEYLGGTSGVLDVSLRPGNMREYQGEAAMSPYLATVQAEGPIVEGIESFNVMGRMSTIQQTAPVLSPRDAPFTFYDVLGRYALQGHDLYCSATGLYTMDRGKINPDRSASLSWSNTVAGARCRGVGPQYPQPFELTAGYSDFRNKETGANGTRRSAALRQYFLRADFQAQLGGLDVDYGANLKLLQYSATLSDRFALPESLSELVDVFRLYGAAEWTPHDHVTVEPSIGTQYKVTEAQVPTLEPRVRVSYRPGGGPDKEVSVALGRYKQLDAGITDERDPGTVFTVLRPAEDGDPLPGALHGLLSYRQRVGDHFEATLGGYVKRHRHIPVSEWRPEAQLEVETARARGTALGVDLRVSYDERPVYLSVGYGWSEVTYAAESGDLGAWIEDPVFEYNPAHDRRHKVNAVASYRLGDYTTSLQWGFGSGRPYTRVYGFDLALDIPEQDPLRFPGTGSIYFSRPYGERFPSYHRLDVSLERDFDLGSGASITAKIGAMNVYNRQNIFYYDLRTLSRVDQTPFFPYLSLQMSVN